MNPWRIPALALLGTLAGLLALSPAMAEPSARLVLICEATAPARPDIVLHLESITLEDANGGRSLPLLQTQLQARDLAQGQLLLVDAEMDPGRYDSLVIRYADIETSAGKARVHPAFPVAGTRIALDREIGPGECLLLRLHWQVRELASEASAYEPDIVLRSGGGAAPLGATAFVACEDSESIWVIDLATLRIVDVFAAPGGPRDLAYSARDQRLYVALATASEIAVYEAQTRRLIRRMPLRFGDEPSRLLLADDEITLYVLNYGTPSLSSFATSSLQETDRIPVGEMPRALAEDPRRGRIFVTSELAGSILVLDPLRIGSEATLPMESSPSELVFDAVAGQLHVASGMQRRLTRVDAETGAVLGQMSLCAPVTGMAYDPLSRQLFAAVSNCQEVAVLQPEDNLEIDNLDLPGRPGRLALDGHSRRLMVTLPENRGLALFNVTGSRLLGVITVGAKPSAVIAP